MTSQRKIIIAAEIFPPEIGGPATYTVKLATELKSRGWDISVICYGDEKINNDKYNFLVHCIKRSLFKPWHYYKYYLKLKSLADQVDVIYAMGPVASGNPALKVAKKLKKKLVVKVVGDYAWERARNSGKTNLLLDDFQNKKFTGKIGLLQEIERRVCSEADKVIVPSEYLKKIVSGWGVKDENIQVVYNSFNPPLDFQRKEVEKTTLISIGRLVPWKGFDVLINLMPELLLLNSDFRLKIFGSGPEEKKLKDLIFSLNLEDKVTIEHVSHQDVMSLASGADIFVLNTGYEGLSHTILEMMFLGVPVIATNIGGNPELIENNVNGVLVEYNNKEQIKEAILKVYNDENLRRTFVENSQEKLKNFTFEKMINDTENFLTSL